VRSPADIVDFVADARGWTDEELYAADVLPLAFVVSWDSAAGLHELATRFDEAGEELGPGGPKVAFLFHEAARNAEDGNPDSTAKLVAGFVKGMRKTVKAGAKKAVSGAKAGASAYLKGLKAMPLFWAGGLMALAYWMS